MKVTISDVYPFEDSGVSTKIERQKKKLQKGKAEPVSVLKIDNDLLVVDGNNTAFAAKQLGLSEVEGKEVCRREQEMSPYREALQKAKDNHQKGYENWPVDSELTKRAERYKENER